MCRLFAVYALLISAISLPSAAFDDYRSNSDKSVSHLHHRIRSRKGLPIAPCLFGFHESGRYEFTFDAKLLPRYDIDMETFIAGRTMFYLLACGSRDFSRINADESKAQGSYCHSDYSQTNVCESYAFDTVLSSENLYRAQINLTKSVKRRQNLYFFLTNCEVLGSYRNRLRSCQDKTKDECRFHDIFADLHVNGTYYFRNGDDYLSAMKEGFILMYSIMIVVWVIPIIPYYIRNIWRKRQDVSLQRYLLRYPVIKLLYFPAAIVNAWLQQEGRPNYTLAETVETIVYAIQHFVYVEILLFICKGWKTVFHKVGRADSQSIYVLVVMSTLAVLIYKSGNTQDHNAQYLSALFYSVVQICVFYVIWFTISRQILSRVPPSSNRKEWNRSLDDSVHHTRVMLTRVRNVYFGFLLLESLVDIFTFSTAELQP